MGIRYLRRPPRPRARQQVLRASHDLSAAGNAAPAPDSNSAAAAVCGDGLPLSSSSGAAGVAARSGGGAGDANADGALENNAGVARRAP